MGSIYVPTKGVASWRELLADPGKHWKDGYSAKELALAWEGINGFPKEVEQILEESNISLFQNLDILYAFPEFKVPIPGGIRASQNDLYVLAKAAAGTVVIMVEGKVREDFGPLVKEKVAHGQAEKRLEFLKNKLEIKNNIDIGEIRYQLLHRTVSAILEAERTGSKAALMLVHSYDPNQAHFDDYANFASLYDVPAVPNKIIGPILGNPSSISIYLGWCSSQPVR